MKRWQKRDRLQYISVGAQRKPQCRASVSIGCLAFTKADRGIMPGVFKDKLPCWGFLCFLTVYLTCEDKVFLNTVKVMHFTKCYLLKPQHLKDHWKYDNTTSIPQILKQRVPQQTNKRSFTHQTSLPSPSMAPGHFTSASRQRPGKSAQHPKHERTTHSIAWQPLPVKVTDSMKTPS